MPDKRIAPVMHDDLQWVRPGRQEKVAFTSHWLLLKVQTQKVTSFQQRCVCKLVVSCSACFRKLATKSLKGRPQ